MKPFIEFEGKVCLVTGAGSAQGIGFAAAKQIGMYGGKVAITSTTKRIFERVKELEESGIEVKGYIADLMDRTQVKTLIEKVVADFKKIDILVNSAGMVQVGKNEVFDEFAVLRGADWDDAIERNLGTNFNATREVIPYMIKNKYGRIVNVSSVTGPFVANPGEAAYCAAKAGIAGLSKAIAIETGKYNVCINNVAPGWIASASQMPEEVAGSENTPIGRGGTPEEVANMITFLASERASYITGQIFTVDGGNIIQEYKGPKELYY